MTRPPMPGFGCETCPTCNGKGYYTFNPDWPMSDNGSSDWADCPDCEGKGTH